MTKQTSKSTVSRLALASVCFLWLAACTGGVALGPDAVKGKTPDGFIEMHEVQAAYIGSGSGEGASCRFAARSMRLMLVASALVASASPPSRPRARYTTSATSGSSPAPMARPAMALRSARRAPAISGCRTRRV